MLKKINVILFVCFAIFAAIYSFAQSNPANSDADSNVQTQNQIQPAWHRFESFPNAYEHRTGSCMISLQDSGEIRIISNDIATSHDRWTVERVRINSAYYSMTVQKEAKIYEGSWNYAQSTPDSKLFVENCLGDINSLPNHDVAARILGAISFIYDRQKSSLKNCAGYENPRAQGQLGQGQLESKPEPEPKEQRQWMARLKPVWFLHVTQFVNSLLPLLQYTHISGLCQISTEDRSRILIHSTDHFLSKESWNVEDYLITGPQMQPWVEREARFETSYGERLTSDMEIFADNCLADIDLLPDVQIRSKILNGFVAKRPSIPGKTSGM